MRFGDSSSAELEKRNLPRLKALPSAEDPVLVYLGPGKDAKTAVFLLDEGVEVQGDGDCKPSPHNCETLHMHVGDTEFLDVKDESGNVTAQYQLDLLSIKTSRTKNAAEAWKARAKVSDAGRRVVRVPHGRQRAAALPLRRQVGHRAQDPRARLQGAPGEVRARRAGHRRRLLEIPCRSRPAATPSRPAPS